MGAKDGHHGKQFDVKWKSTAKRTRQNKTNKEEHTANEKTMGGYYLYINCKFRQKNKKISVFDFYNLIVKTFSKYRFYISTEREKVTCLKHIKFHNCTGSPTSIIYTSHQLCNKIYEDNTNKLVIRRNNIFILSKLILNQ